MKKLIYVTTLLLISTQYCFTQSHITLLFEREAAYEHFSGNVMVLQNGETYFAYSSGYADQEAKVKNSIKQSFDIGSVSKQFTAAGILHLAMKGQMDLHAPINNYLGKSGSKRWKNVTTHHLLTHTSGIPSLFQSGQGLDDIMPQESQIEINELIAYFKDKKLNFKPGEEYQYSNSGYVLLAKLIESISGQHYKEYMKKKVFEKYGLVNTQFGTPENTYAKPYFGYRKDLMESAPIFDASWAIGAGGIYSTIEDLRNWLTITRSQQFLDEQHRSLYFKPHQPKRGGSYGYGWEFETSEDSKIIQHDGANFGYVSYLGFRPDKGDAVIILTNQTHSSINLIGKSSQYVKDLANKIWMCLDGEEIEVLPEKNFVTNQTFDGQYKFNSDSYTLNIENCGNQYKIIGSDQYTPARMVFNNELNNTDDKSLRLQKVASLIPQKKYWKMASAFDGEMKFVIYSGLFSWGFGQVTDGLGEISRAVPFQIGNTYGKFRMYGEDSILDMVVYFNEEGFIKGIFEDGWNNYSDNRQIVGYPIGANQIYVDGFPYGEKSATITIEANTMIFSQLGRSFKALKVN